MIFNKHPGEQQRILEAADLTGCFGRTVKVALLSLEESLEKYHDEIAQGHFNYGLMDEVDEVDRGPRMGRALFLGQGKK